MTLTFIQGHSSTSEQKASAPLISPSSWSIWMERGVILRLVGHMTHLLILSVQSVFKGENSTFVILLKRFNIFLCLDICRLISFRLGIVIESIKLYILNPVLRTLTFIQVYSCMRDYYFCAHFLMNFSVDLDDIHFVTATFWSVEAHTKFILQDQYSWERIILKQFYKMYL